MSDTAERQQELNTHEELFNAIWKIDALSTGDDIREVLYRLAHRIIGMEEKHRRLIEALRLPPINREG